MIFRRFIPALFFLLILSYFFGTNAWYAPSRLVIHGIAVSAAPQIDVRWDSGQGFNSYEQRQFRPAIHPLDAQNTNEIIVGATGKKNSASLSQQVVCTAIFVDGKQLDLGTLQTDIPYSADGLHFIQGQTVSLTVKASWHIGFEFQTNNHAGVAHLELNGVKIEKDLYMANEAAKYKRFDYWLLQPDGSFTVEMDMPRYTIRELEIVNGSVDQPIQLISAEIRGKEHVVDLLQERAQQLGTARSPDVLKSMRSYFNPGQFCQQIIFSLLTLWLLFALVRQYIRVGGIRDCFAAEQRCIFWLFFCASLAVFGTWLAAFWPGVMSVDSLKVWRAAMLPDVYLNDHPLLNVFLYKYLYQLWSNPAVVPVVQVVLMSLLISWFFFWLYRQELSLKILLPCLLFILCSVPVGIYNTVLWKDIPFALLVVFWACMLVKLYRERCLGKLWWSRQRIAALFLLGLALGLIRHNGLVYLIILPLMFIVLRLVSLKKTCIGILLCALLAGIGYTVLKRTGGLPGTEFIAREIHHYTGGLSAAHLVADSDRVVRDYMKVFDFDATDQKWDKVHYYFKDRYAYWFLLHSGWWDLYPYQKKTIHFQRLRHAAMQVYEKSYQQPWVWFSWNPVWLLGLLPVVTLLFWWFPNTAIVGAVLLAGALPLIYLRIFNWRYYYFLYLGLLFMLPLIPLDLFRKKLDGTT